MGYRFGLDGIIGLIPGVGDLATGLMSLWILSQASRFGVSQAVLIRMAFNIFLENFIDLIPFVGNFFDFFWKSNSKNLKLLEDHLTNPQGTTKRSTGLLIVVGFVSLSFVLGSAFIAFKVIYALVHWITH